MASPMLALPAAGTTGGNAEQRRGGLPIAVLVGGVGIVMAFAGLVAAYLSLRTSIAVWPPEGTEYDNYSATTLAITVLLGAATVEWAAYGIRKGFRGQALFGYAATVVLGLGFINGLYYLISRLEVAAGSSPYSTVLHAMTGLSLLLWIGVVLAVLLVFFKAIGHQLTDDNYEQARVAAFAWHIGTLAWLAVFYCVFITK